MLKPIRHTLQVADSVEKEDDILDYYVSGDSVPLGRLSYLYSRKNSNGKRYGMMKHFLSLILTILLVLTVLFAQVSSVGNSNNANKLSVTYITGTDALGRKIKPVADFREDRFVGIFYFAWHNSDQHKVFDVTKILRENPDDLWSMDPKNPIAPRATYYFNEPLYGYYSSSDPYVIRKHIELFIAAGIDFIAYDFTNFQIYWDPLYRMLDLLIEYGNAGWKVPQVMFFTKTAQIRSTVV